MNIFEWHYRFGYSMKAIWSDQRLKRRMTAYPLSLHSCWTACSLWRAGKRQANYVQPREFSPAQQRSFQLNLPFFINLFCQSISEECFIAEPISFWSCSLLRAQCSFSNDLANKRSPKIKNLLPNHPGYLVVQQFLPFQAIRLTDTMWNLNLAFYRLFMS